jgi:hypothetical protein
MPERTAHGARKPSRWLLAGLVVFVVSVYVATILARMLVTNGG